MNEAHAQTAATETENSAPIARLTGRLAYSSEAGVVAGLGFATNRFLGRDQTLEFRIKAEDAGTQVNLRYNNDAIFGDSPVFGLGVLHAQKRSGDAYEFDSTVTRIEPSLTWKVSSALTASTYAWYGRTEIEDVPASSSILIRADEGKETSGGIGGRIEYRFPTETGRALRKARTRVSLEYGSSSAGHDFVRLAASGQMIHAFKNGNVVLRSQVRFGALHSQSGTSNIGDRYVLGQGSLRGFEFGGGGPRDLTVGNQPALGGNYFGVIKFDVQFPNAFGDHKRRIVPGLFFDAGSLWSLDNTAGGNAGADIVDDASHIRASVGLSLQMETGLGAIKLYVARPFMSESYDHTQAIGLELSHTF